MEKLHTSSGSDLKTIRLSALLKDLTPHETASVLSQWNDGLASVIYSLPDPKNTTFTVKTGRKGETEIPEELVLDTPELHDWLSTTKSQAHLDYVLKTGQFTDLPPELYDDPEMFMKLAEARRKYLKSAGKTSTQAPRAVAPKAKSRRKSDNQEADQQKPDRKPEGKSAEVPNENPAATDLPAAPDSDPALAEA